MYVPVYCTHEEVHHMTVLGPKVPYTNKKKSKKKLMFLLNPNTKQNV